MNLRVIFLAAAMVMVTWKSVQAQGTFNLINSALSRVTIDLDGDGVGDRTAVSADGIRIDFYYGIGVEPPTTFVGHCVISPSSPGILMGFPSIMVIPTASPGQVVSLRVVASGDLSGDCGFTTNLFGQTEVLQFIAGPSAGPGTVVWGSVNSTATNRFRPLVVSANPAGRVFARTQGVGVVVQNPDLPAYSAGDVVLLTAQPGRWHVFTQWNDGSAENPRSIVVGFDPCLTAVFTPTQALETLTLGGTTRTAPVGTPAFFTDGAYNGVSNHVGRGSVELGIESTFQNGRIFYRTDGNVPDITDALYTGPVSIRKSCQIRAVAFNADFSAEVESDPLNIVVLPDVAMQSKGGGQTSVYPPVGAYLSNGTAIVTAMPDPGWTFISWRGASSDTNPTVTLQMDDDKCLEAVFGTTLSSTTVGNGTVHLDPLIPIYPYGSAIRLTGIPAAGNQFVLWGNAANSTNASTVFGITNSNPVITAVFGSLASHQETLTVRPDGFGTVSTAPRGNRFNRGTVVVLSATPNPGQEFLRWSGDATGTNNQLVIEINRSKLVVAEFSKRPLLTPFVCDDRSGKNALILSGAVGHSYSIEGALVLQPDPRDTVWVPLAVVTNEIGSIQFDVPSGGDSWRFFRARLDTPATP